MSSKPNTPSAKIRLDHFDNSKFDRGAPLVAECLWWFIRPLAFLNPFPIPSRLKVAILRFFGAKVGNKVIIRSNVRISFPWKLIIGDHVWIGDDVQILSLAQVTIGSHVCISQQAFLCTGSHDFRSESFDLITEPITVGPHSWIAARAFVAPGTNIPPQTMVRANTTITQKSF